MEKKHVIIDCDPGADDALALMLALNSEELTVHGVTVVAGNRDVDRCGENAMKVMEHYGRTDIPVAKGADKPLKRTLCLDDIYSGRDGMAETFLPYKGTPCCDKNGVDLMIETAKQYPGELTVISTAPMTNLALAIEKDPDFTKNLASIVTINGSYGVSRKEGWYNARKEWNVCVDPEAAKIVMESGIPVWAMGVDVTGQLTNEIHEKLVNSGTPGTMPYGFLTDAKRFLATRGLEPSGLFVDAMAVACAVKPEIARFVRGKAAVETAGELTTGMTLFDNVGNFNNASDLYAAYSFDFEMLTELLARRVMGNEKIRPEK
ncbi:nucleoside hydrolase [Clostridium sp. MCC353]|uniref:nucleoside hydrolase n=1 Tax=Clostridium sp. MCC353 TaxID=2592646 RepID=UPI001C01A693|nr:nucleoside hydrolase [Clostridium sp. MCC353]MBT9774955.1 nucleoside hydrolase [Clostridium sp. MCC353]